MVRRLALSALVVSLLFLAFGGLYGGVEMLRDPGGGSLTLGLVLGVWLAVQGWMIGFAWPIQFVTAGNGVTIVVLALLPVVRRSFASMT